MQRKKEYQEYRMENGRNKERKPKREGKKANTNRVGKGIHIERKGQKYQEYGRKMKNTKKKQDGNI